MNAKDMLSKVQELKEQVIVNGFYTKPADVDKFLSDNWMQILDILDDALYKYLTGEYND